MSIYYFGIFRGLIVERSKMQQPGTCAVEAVAPGIWQRLAVLSLFVAALHDLQTLPRLSSWGVGSLVRAQRLNSVPCSRR
jgi:hypothetical protein